MLTRKHFKRIANIIKNNKLERNKQLLIEVLHFLKEENTRFDSIRFLEYIGYETKKAIEFLNKYYY
ncbi:MAG: hypothetical protein N2114_05255 [Candidatus Goldbacteria bacterium]|nr:hypothetical protein [Candidatus Goldiibacteriota bacterium]